MSISFHSEAEPFKGTFHDVLVVERESGRKSFEYYLSCRDAIELVTQHFAEGLNLAQFSVTAVCVLNDMCEHDISHVFSDFFEASPR